MERTGNSMQAYRSRSNQQEVSYVRTSVPAGSGRSRVPSGAAHPISCGDRIFVRLVSVERGWRTIAEFTLTTVADMSDVYGELRHYTAGQRGLTRLYVRNATRGWSFEQPFMLYANVHRRPATSVTHPVSQPSQPTLWQSEPAARQIPTAVRQLYGL